jgi:prepilin-type processing-associated H-X9-DG protein
VFARAREKARQTSCLSNTKQLALGAAMYASDHDECVVPAYIGGDGWIPWMDLLVPYVMTEQIYECPSYAGHLSYGANLRYVCEPPIPAHNFHGPTSLADIDKPAETIVLGESGKHKLTSGSWSYGMARYITPYNPEDDVPDFSYSNPPDSTPHGHFVYLRHNKMANIAFCDGHAKACGSRIVHDVDNWKADRD